MKKLCRTLLVPVALLSATAGWAEILVADQGVGVPPAAGDMYRYQHPSLRSLVFSSPESRGQAILPPSPYFVPPPTLIWRAPGSAPIYPYVVQPPGYNRPGNLSAAELARYNLARAQAMRQGLYKKNTLWLGYSGMYYPNAYMWPAPYAWGWVAPPYAPLTPPAATGQSHPSNRDNASYLIDRAHRFSTDAYRKP